MQRRFLLQILLLAQHVSGTTMPTIRSSRVLYSGCCLVVFGAVVFKLLFWCGAEGYVSGLQDAAAKWCPKHLEQAIRTAIKSSVASSGHSISTYEHSFVSMQQRAIYLKTYVRCIFAGDINLP